MSSHNVFLVTGSSGQVGSHLLSSLAPLGKVISPQRAELDLSNPDSIRDYVHEHRPTWIIHPAAYTTVDKAESEKEQAYTINSEASRILAEEAKLLNAPIISFSTDYVFDGTGETARSEDAPVAPLNVYGASKLAGEQAMLQTGAASLIFRTSWVYSVHGNNFVKTIMRLAGERESLNIVNDQHGAPTSAQDLADMTAAVIQHIQDNGGDAMPLRGVYHATGGGETTWFGFANHIVSRLKEHHPGKRWAEISPVPSSAFPTPAKRPNNSRLSGAKLHETFNWMFPQWEQSVDAVMQRLLL